MIKCDDSVHVNLFYGAAGVYVTDARRKDIREGGNITYDD